MIEEPEIKQYLMIFFGCFMAICVGFVYRMTLVKTPENDRTEVAREMIPLITIGIIVAAVYALAVAQLVKENTVAAILGALAGYVLGKGKQAFSSDKTHKQGEKR